ncbi:acriflavine resistance protein B [Roseomonas terrae]|jgi:hydrophobe/amphiphile efflux-1 (HAE1) family protein|uniref:Acriflavine resistance protein B n=1 Tax=Neoroseomonas terrae TaxID=424799 RepID=A0ABS5EQP1_9PROT|nr:efflux RND transporter permease subunit [Neoroseomonas terrae]MBR0653358.1 acriflavine resistance protein B [Neoroseomonas terrae]
MSISAPFIARPIGTSLLAIGLALAGFVAYFNLPVAPLPRVDFPTIAVSASQPGADPVIMAASVAAPLERRLGEIPGVTEMTSSSSLGSTNVIVQFDLSRSIESAARDVQAAINAAGPDLPSGLTSPPSFRKLNPADAPVLILALTSDTVAPGVIYDAADSILGPRIAQVPGTAQVSLAGAEQPAIRVSVDPAAAAAAGVSMDDIRRSITAANVTQATGFIDGPEQSAAIIVNDRLSSAADFGSIIIRRSGDALVRLDGVATVEDGPRDRRQAGLYNGRPAVIVSVFKQADANVLEVVDNIRELLPDLQRWMPAGINVTIMRDRSETIRASVYEVEHALLISIVLVVLVVAAFLRRKSAIFAAGIAVPLSLLGTIGCMWLAGFSLNNFTLMALTISVGFVVDDAIVMIENMARFTERGLKPMEAALEGAKQIGFTVVSISLSLIAVFIPLLFMGGIVGRMFREFAATLSIAVAISALISLTVTPMLAAHLASRAPRPPGWFGRTFEALMDRLIAGYMRSLAVALRWRRSMIALTIALVGVTVWLYTVVPRGFFPDQDSGLIFGSVQAQPDTSFQQMTVYQQQVMDVIRADPAVENVSAAVGGGGLFGGGASVRLQLTLVPQDQRPGLTANDVINRLRRPLSTVTGTQTFMRPVSDIVVGGRQGNASYQYVLLTPSIEDLFTWSEALVRQLRTVPQIEDVSSDQQRTGLVTRLVVDRDAAARLGIPVNSLDAALNNAFAQRQVSTIYRTRNQYRVVFEVDPTLTQAPEDLERIFLPGRDGPVPLGAVVKLERGISPRSITHQGLFPASTITFNLAAGVSLGEAAAAIEKAALDIQMPATIRGEFAGNARAFQNFQAGLPLLILAAVLAIYIVLGVLYESLIHPLTILSTLPTAGIGALLALLATGLSFTVIALIGVILLMGIVKKNAIMMVDFALEHEREGGEGGMQAILEACRERFRPILMTTLAALFGAVPLAFATGPGAELRSPLGITIIGGMILSQVLTLYTTPVVYLALERLATSRRKPLRGVAPAE